MVNIVSPKIELIASTQLANTQEGRTVIEELMNLDPSATDAENLTEFAGRGCYESWDKPNPKTAHNDDYIRRTAFDMQHGSILEHASVTLRFSGVSRAWLVEMSRHRHLSWSVVSQRYVDGEKFGAVIPPAIPRHENPADYALSHAVKVAENAYDELVNYLSTHGDYTRKQAREAARSVLPNCTEVRGVVTGNLRAWANIIPLRASEGADAEMQEVTRLILEAVTPVAPAIFNEVAKNI